LINKIPLKVKKVKVTSVDMDWWVVVHQGKILLEKRPHQGIWAGLWSFPEQLALPPSAKKIELPSIKHILTHRRLNIRPVQMVVSKSLSNLDQKLEWIDLSDLKSLGLPTPVKSFLKNSNLVRDDA